MPVPNTIDITKISPRAVQVLQDLAQSTGNESLERTIEELAFAMLELNQIIDTQKDPLLEPEAARRQMETMRGTLQRFKRYSK